MSDVTDYLDQVQARADAATDGPWWTAQDGVIYGKDAHHPGYAQAAAQSYQENEEFITAARTDVPKLVAALRAALRQCDEIPDPCDPGDEECMDCRAYREVRNAITEALEGDSDE